jgi:hypothetical protein
MADTEDRLKPETKGRAAIPGTKVPRTATKNTLFTFFWSLRINHVFFRIRRASPGTTEKHCRTCREDPRRLLGSYLPGWSYLG